MSLVERCVHQGLDIGAHVLFKEQWERCKNCTYDPENNKMCAGYSPTAYNLPDEKNIFESNLKIVYSATPPDLNKSIA